MGHRVGVGVVQAALRLLRRSAGKIDLDRVARDRELDRIAQRRAERIVRDLGAVDAIGKSADGIAHCPFGSVLHSRCQGAQVMHPVIVHEGQQAVSPKLIGGDKGMNIAEDLG